MSFPSGVNSLVTPAGTLTFNGTVQPRVLVAAFTGDNATIRTAVDNAPQRDLAIVHNALAGARYPGLTVFLDMPDAATAAVYEDTIKNYLGSIMKADGKLLFTPPGQAQRYLTVRCGDLPDPLFEPAQTGSFGEPVGFLRVGTLPLIAGDPYAYTLTQQSTDITNGGSVVITNAGNAPSYPVLNVFGPFTAFTVTNSTLSQTISMGATNPMSIAAGHSVQIITSLETCIRDGSAQHVEGYLDVAASDFWYLAPDPDATAGANTITASFTGGSGSTKVTVLSNSAWR